MNKIEEVREVNECLRTENAKLKEENKVLKSDFQKLQEEAKCRIDTMTLENDRHIGRILEEQEKKTSEIKDDIKTLIKIVGKYL